MNIEEMWSTPIGTDNFVNFVRAGKLLDEVMNHPEIMAQTKVGSLRISDRMDEFPHLTQFIQHRLTHRFEHYMYQAFGYRPRRVSWSAWVHTCFHGQGLVPHYHMGDEHVASILYLTESKAGLVVRDPRANMVRNFPQELLKTNFQDYQHNPREGDFIIFPTYLDHYVMAAEPDFRVSIAIDWCFE